MDFAERERQARNAGAAGPAAAQAAPSHAARPAAGAGYAAQAAALSPRSQGVEQSVTGLGNLRGPQGGAQVTTNFDDPDAADPNTPLPFTQTGWDAQTILKNVGQADKIEGTDSDGVRCVQAVSLASHVLRGPADVVSFLGTSILKMLFTGARMENGQARFRQPSPREVAAGQVLAHVQRRIMERSATYGDLSWAQEALHAMFLPQDRDNLGTPDTDVMQHVNPGGQGALEYTSHQNATSTGQEFRTLAQFAPLVDGLKPGEQLIVIQYLRWAGAAGQSAHQLIVYNEGGTPYLYDPQETSAKVQPIQKGGGGLENLFKRDSTRTKWIRVAGRRAAS